MGEHVAAGQPLPDYYRTGPALRFFCWANQLQAVELDDLAHGEAEGFLVAWERWRQTREALTARPW